MGYTSHRPLYFYQKDIIVSTHYKAIMVLYHIRPYFVGISPYIGLKNRPKIYGRYLQSIGSCCMAMDTLKSAVHHAMGMLGPETSSAGRRFSQEPCWLPLVLEAAAAHRQARIPKKIVNPKIYLH